MSLLSKEAKVLSPTGRDKIKEKNFAIPEGRKYPIHDEGHARNALTRVRQHGTQQERAQVYSAVAKKYPGLAERSSIQNVQRRAKNMKTAAPISLIRKLAEGETAQERLKLIQRKRTPLEMRHAGQIAIPAMLGGAAGGVLGGAAGLHYLGDPVNPGVAGAGLGMLGGIELAKLHPKVRETSDKLDDLEKERAGLAGMYPSATGELSDETLDRERYHKARAQVAKHTLGTREAAKPISRGAMLGLGAGAGLGALLAPKEHVFHAGKGWQSHSPSVPRRLASGGIGALLGVSGGALLGTALMGHEGRKNLDRSGTALMKAQGRKDDVWNAAAQLEDRAPVEEVRKAASALAFDDLTTPTITPTEWICQSKVASAADEELMCHALTICDRMDESVDFYESMGGTYKHAFGTQMFDSKQMAGSPAVSGGNTNRVRTPNPLVQPQAAPAAANASSGQARTQAASAPSMVSTTSAPSAPTG